MRTSRSLATRADRGVSFVFGVASVVGIFNMISL
jgi:hypothetical protein